MRPTAVVLHFDPDKVVAGICDRAVSCRTVGAEYRATGYLLALHNLDYHWIPDLGIRRRVERGVRIFHWLDRAFPG
jgi:hypothetical protein